MERIDLLSTIKGSRFEGFFPREWDLSRIDWCCSRKPEEVNAREKYRRWPSRQLSACAGG